MKLFKDKRKGEPTIPVVAMSDIAFLLIIFFLVTTNFIKESHIKLKLPKAEATQKEEKIQVSVTVDQDGVVYLNGEETQGLNGDLSILLGDREGEHRRVFLKCHKELAYDEFMPVIENINKAGGILVLKTDDKSSMDKEKEAAKKKKKDGAPAPAKTAEAPSAAEATPGAELKAPNPLE